MSLRTRAREVALQILFEDDVNPRQTVAELQEFVNGRLANPEGREFCLELILGVRRNQAELDQAITQIAENWSLGRMAPTDRNCLRLGAFEVLHAETPYKVAINEAVELAKRFGSSQSPAFVNGILDKLPSEEARDSGNGSEKTG